MSSFQYIIPFSKISISDLAQVGGKNASLGEMFNQLRPIGVQIPDGFALNADAYRLFRKANHIEKALSDLLLSLDTENFTNLSTVGSQARKLITDAKLPEEIIKECKEAYSKLCESAGVEILDVAVRSSATAEDLPTASFAGRMESYLNISGYDQLAEAIHKCYVSLFTDRAIKYRQDMGFMEMDIAISSYLSWSSANGKKR